MVESKTINIAKLSWVSDYIGRLSHRKVMKWGGWKGSFKAWSKYM